VRGFFSSHIIAILAAILFPVFAKAREKARQTSCLSNVKQLGLAIMQYTQDYDETLPASYYPGNPSISDTWYEKMDPYVKNTQVLRCPSATSTYPAYGWNYDYIGYGSSTSITVYSIGSITNPSETIMLADAGNYVIYRPSRYMPNYQSDTLFAYNYAGARHNEGANIAWCDGHAKWMHWSKYLLADTLWDRS
jgi:prepilin-type processing-associated H-X9-DG protein